MLPGVLEYVFARDGQALLYAVSSRKEEENGAYAVTPGAEGAPVALLAGKGRSRSSPSTGSRDRPPS